jgi:demethylmenaquinone methyltransferase/2-methoxy-6-polyprenyl-1,4-benzoquinol methylase
MPSSPRRRAPASRGRPGERLADFGYRRVPEAAKASLVRRVFDSVAPRYDLMNDLMSVGLHRRWKAALVDWLGPRKGMTLLDAGGGTGDVALRFRERGGGRAIVLDANARMLGEGRGRAAGRGGPEGVLWVAGDAEALPLPDSSVDAYATAFCIRNVTRPEIQLAEARRVLKPGGRFLCLEFSRLAVPALDRLYDAYSFGVLPALGRAVAGDAEAYRYLAESIRRFPAQEPFARMIQAAGLARVAYRNLAGGVAAIHSAWRL